VSKWGLVFCVEGGGSLSFDVGQRLAGGQVVDGDFVSLPVGAGEEDVAAGGHRIIRSSFQAEAALLRHRQPRSGTWTPRSRMARLEGGRSIRTAMVPSCSPGGGEVYGGFFEGFTIQGVDHDAGRGCTLFCVGATIAVGHACLTNKEPRARWR
jgi:hypothetical protein